MKKLLIILLIAIVFQICFAEKVNLQKETKSITELINSVFSELREIRYMRPPKKYSAFVDSIEYTEKKEFYLRKRNPTEIIKSKLTSGCGDSAFAFYYLIRKHNTECSIIDAVKISNSSLINNFSGHMVVKVIDKNNNKTLLVDPSRKEIIDENWDNNRKSFNAFNSEFWIGFNGAFVDYPIHNASELKEFYNKSLNNIPKEILKEKILGLNLQVGNEFSQNKDVSDEIANLNLWLDNAYKKYKIQPHKFIIIIQKSKTNNISIYKDNHNKWICEINGIEDLSLTLLDSIEIMINENID